MDAVGDDFGRGVPLEGVWRDLHAEPHLRWLEVQGHGIARIELDPVNVELLDPLTMLIQVDGDHGAVILLRTQFAKPLVDITVSGHRARIIGVPLAVVAPPNARFDIRPGGQFDQFGKFRNPGSLRVKGVPPQRRMDGCGKPIANARLS